MDKKNIRILVSACLLGVNCRYDGKNGRRDEVLELLKEYELIPVCPEQMLPIIIKCIWPIIM